MIVSVKDLGNGVMEYDTGKAIVRIHPGKRTEEERRVALEKSAQKYWKAIQNQKRAKS